jgi:hypothetical protein
MDKNKILKPIREIEIPVNFKTVITKLHPEIKDVVDVDISTTVMINPVTLRTEHLFNIMVDIHFNQNDLPNGGGRAHYQDILNNLFKMTYGSEMNFVSFSVNSLVIPFIKTNEEKFIELFGKNK